jgi:hypothetical protein
MTLSTSGTMLLFNRPTYRAITKIDLFQSPEHIMATNVLIPFVF